MEEVKTEVSDYDFLNFTQEMRVMFNEVLAEVLIHRGVSFPDSVGILVTCKKDFGTACVQFPMTPNGSHKVTIGFGINENREKGGMKGTIEGYARIYVLHEFGHIFSLYPMLKAEGETLESFGKRLQKNKVPFQLWNLFQDAHDEEFVRNLLKIKFNWLAYEEYPQTPSTAEALLWCLIQNEGTYPRFKKAMSPKGLKMADRVESYYYKEILKCDSLAQLEKLLVEWVKEYGNPTESWGRGSTPGGIPMAAGASAGDLEFSSQEEGSGPPSSGGKEVSLGSLGDTSDQGPYQTPEDLSNQESQDGGVGNLGCVVQGRKGGAVVEGNSGRSSAEVSDICREGIKLSKQLEKLLKHGYKEISDRTGSRLDVVAQLTGSPDYFIDEGQSKSFLKASILVDLSGSMGGSYIRNGLILVWAFRELAKKRKLEGYVVFSKVARAALSTRIELKAVTKGTIGAVVADGGAEGIFEAIQEHSKALNKSSKVYVYTDAQICDKVLSNEERWNILPKPVVGCYVGDSRGNKSALKFFNSWLISPDISTLGKAMIAESKGKRSGISS